MAVLNRSGLPTSLGAVTEASYLSSTRAAYDTVAEDYADLLHDELARKPLDRALLAVFAELAAAVGGPVGDLGCGPGRVTAYLASVGADAFGIDLSPRMIEVARRRHPGLSFDVAPLAAVPRADGSLGGVVAWYSVIHTPPSDQPAVYAEFARLLAPGAPLLMAFQAGEGRVRLTHGYGHDIELDAHRLSPEQVCADLREVGLLVTSRTVREAVHPEKTQQGYLLAHRAG